MSETHFRWHFWPFQINTKLYSKNVFTKWPPAPILDVRIFLNCLTKWLSSAILDVRDKLSMTFLAILDQYGIVFF